MGCKLISLDGRVLPIQSNLGTHFHQTAADEDLKAQVATNTAFVTKASECAKEGKGVQVTDKGLVCAADPAPDKCDDAAVGKIKVCGLLLGLG